MNDARRAIQLNALDKGKETNLEKYGKRYASQVDEFKDKMKKQILNDMVLFSLPKNIYHLMY